jgi:hypothetical protein
MLSSRRRRILFIILAILGLLVPNSMVPSGSAQQQAGGAHQQGPPDKFTIRFKSRPVHPTPGVDVAAIQRTAGPDGRVHFLLQVQDLPDAAGRQRFAAQGISLLNYVTGNTYIASGRASDLANLRSLPGVRWAGPLDPDDKVSADLKAGNIGQWARAAGGLAALSIQVHPDVSIRDAQALVTRLGGTLVESVPAVPSVTATFHPGQAQRIAREDAVQFVDVADPPLKPHNDGARAAANINPLAAAPYNLTGAGVTVLVYDVGQIDAHLDFGARIIQNDGSAVADHATHVAGTLGGSGTNSNGNNSAGNPVPTHLLSAVAWGAADLTVG